MGGPGRPGRPLGSAVEILELLARGCWPAAGGLEVEPNLEGLVLLTDDSALSENHVRRRARRIRHSPPKVAIVAAHAGSSASGERRLLVMAAMLRRMGLPCDVFRPSKERRDVHSATETTAELRFCPVDNVDEPINQRNTSAELIRCLMDGEYSTIAIKGLQYDVGKQILEAGLGTRHFAAILGGTRRDPNLERYGFFFTEHAGQDSALSGQVGKRVVIQRLPKHFPINDWTAFRGMDKTYDAACVGHVSELKNQVLLTPLFDTEHRIVFVGDGPKANQLRESASGHSNVIVAGRRSWRDTIGIVSSSRVLVHPSKSEGLPRAIVEALACGVPVVGLESTLESALGNEPACLLVPPSTLCAEVAALLKNASRLEQMRQAALAYFEQNHNADAFGHAVEVFCNWVSHDGTIPSPMEEAH